MTVEDVLKKVEFEEKWLLSAGYNAYNADIAFHTIKWAVKQLSTETENVGEMSEKSYNSIKTELSGDLISRQAVITMLNKIENAVEDGEGYQFNEWVEYVKELSTEEVQPIVHCNRCEFCSKSRLNILYCDVLEILVDKDFYCGNAKMDGKE